MSLTQSLCASSLASSIHLDVVKVKKYWRMEGILSDRVKIVDVKSNLKGLLKEGFELPLRILKSED